MLSRKATPQQAFACMGASRRRFRSCEGAIGHARPPLAIISLGVTAKLLLDPANPLRVLVVGVVGAVM